MYLVYTCFDAYNIEICKQRVLGAMPCVARHDPYSFYRVNNQGKA